MLPIFILFGWSCSLHIGAYNSMYCSSQDIHSHKPPEFGNIKIVLKIFDFIHTGIYTSNLLIKWTFL